MRCYYTYVKDIGKILIPGCMGVAVHNDIDYCTCKSNSDYNFEKKEYNRILKEKEEYINVLEKEIENLNLIIETKST